MKKMRILATVLALLFAALPLTPAVQFPVPLRVAQVAAQPGSGITFWWFQLRDELGLPIPTTVPATCAVYTAGGDTLATIYSEATLTTTQTNPITAAALFSGQGNHCSFYTANTVTSVDVIAWTKRSRARLSGYTANASQGHIIVMDRQMTTKILKVPFTNSAGNKTQTTFQIPKGAAVRDVLIEVITAVVDAHIAIGIDAGEAGGNDAGFCGTGTTKVGDTVFGKSLESTGWHKCHAVLVTGATTGANLDFFYAAFHSGALISRGRVGSDTLSPTVNAHAGSYVRFPYVGNGVAKTVVYTTNNKAVTGNFYLLVEEFGNDPTNQ